MNPMRRVLRYLEMLDRSSGRKRRRASGCRTAKNCHGNYCHFMNVYGTISLLRFLFSGD